MKNLIYFRNGSIAVIAVLMIIISCTELKDESFDQIQSSQFVATGPDGASLAGAAYVNWRDLLLEWNTLYRAQEVSSDEMLTPARPNGWVDGGVYRRIHEHKWTTDDDIVINVWGNAYKGIYQLQQVYLPGSIGSNSGRCKRYSCGSR